MLARTRAGILPHSNRSHFPIVTTRRSIVTREQKSGSKAEDEDIGNHLTGGNKFSGKGGRLGASDIIFLVLGIAIVGYVGSLAKDEVKEVTWPKIKQKGKEVREAVKEVGGK